MKGGAGERGATDAQGLREILRRSVAIGCRDAIHLATMERHGISRILSFDRTFDAVPALTRLRV